MAALSKALASPCFSTGSSLKSVDQNLGCRGPNYLSFRTIQTEKRQSSNSRRALTVQAGYSDGGSPGNASIFIGGFILGGLVMGALSCVYAPKISKALAGADTLLNGADKKDLMRKLPKFIYDEEKALEKKREALAKKIDQLNSAIDNVSSQLRPEGSSDEPDVEVELGVPLDTDELGVA